MWSVLQNLVNLLAIPTFLLLIWQILRNEGQQPPLSIVEKVESEPKFLDVDGVKAWSVGVQATAEGGESLNDARIIPLGATRFETEPESVPVLDPNGENRLEARLMAPVGKPIIAVFIACRHSVILRRSIAVSTRLTVALNPRIDVSPHDVRLHMLSVDSRLWQWDRLAWLKHRLNRLLAGLHVRKRFRLGSFRKNTAPYWKSDLPEYDLSSEAREAIDETLK